MILRSLYISMACALSALSALAVELDDVRGDLTRKQADALAGPYTYQVMSDLSVRRTWEREELGYTLSMDFDARTDKLICATLVYGQPVSREKAVADAEQMAHVEGTKWNRLDDEKVGKYGFYHAYCAKLEGGAMLFRETVTGGKTERVTYYTATPKTDRRHLEEWSSSVGTAMGSRAMGASGGKTVIQDEQRRFRKRQAMGFAPMDAEAAAAFAASAELRPEPAPSPRTSTAQGGREKQTASAREKKVDPNSRMGRLNLLFIKLFGRPVCQQDYLIAGGVLAIFLLMGICVSLSSRARDRRMQRQYERMMMGRTNAEQALRGKVLAGQIRKTKRRR